MALSHPVGEGCDASAGDTLRRERRGPELPIFACLLYIFVEMQDWDDIRVFLAAARAGSLSGAARHLGTSQPTVSRRIAALEERYKVSLFDRHRDGLCLTDAGRTICQSALQIEELAFAIDRNITSKHATLAGTVRVSVTEGLCALWLTPLLAPFTRQHARITLELVAEDAVSDLTRREADIAVRLECPRSVDLYGRRVGSLVMGLFASTSYVSENGLPENPERLSEHRLVDCVPTSMTDERWQEVTREHARIVCRTNSAVGCVNAVRAGHGIGLLPVYVRTLYPELVPVLRGQSWRDRDIWLVAHKDLRTTARIRAVFDELVHLFETKGRVLADAGSAEHAAAAASGSAGTAPESA